MRKPSYLPIIAVVAVLLGLLGFVNYEQHKMAPSSPDDDAAQQTTKQPASDPKAEAATTSAQELSTEATIGNPATAQVKYTLGYYTTSNIEEHVDTVQQNIQALESFVKSNPTASLQLVCLDIPPDMRADPSTAGIQEGLYANGRKFGNPDLTQRDQLMTVARHIAENMSP